MVMILEEEHFNYTFNFWRIQNLRADRLGQVEKVSCDLCLYKDRAAADSGVSPVNVHHYEFLTTREMMLNSSGDEHLAWLYANIRGTDPKFENAPDDEMTQ
jgi:hypothetical protein